MISMKEYAEKHDISYEAVRKQVKRYQNDLKPHIHKVGRVNYLDEEAEAFLDEKRSKNPVIVVEDDRKNEIQRLYDENKALLLKITELQSLLICEKDKVQQLQDALLAEREQVKQLQSQLLVSQEKENENERFNLDNENFDNASEPDINYAEDEGREQNMTLWEKFKSWWK